MNKPHFFILPFLIFFALPSQSQTTSLKQVAESKTWQRLLHYKEKVFGGVHSYVDSPDFFLSGKKDDSLAELEATIQAFENDSLEVGRLKQHPQCAFPARYRYLKERLGLKTKNRDCADFQEWKKNLDVKNISYVFSSAYPNNPASIFGHTLLKLSANKSVQNDSDPYRHMKHELLDYGVTFAADAEPSGLGLEYIVFGLLGGYRGYFNVAPYFHRINEYNHTDSRDLWEYELNLNQPQIDRLVEHLWELFTTAYFDYFFIDENCSFHILSLLEIANPEWDLLDHFNTYTLPADTVKLIANVGAVRKAHFRPSLRKNLHAKIHALNPSEKKAFHAILDDPEIVKQNTDPEVLDTAIAYYNYFKHQKADKFKDSEALRMSLVQRARVGGKSETRTLTFRRANQPDLGHHSSTLGLQAARFGDENAIGLKYRWGLHDLLDDDIGYEPFSEVGFGQGTVYYLPENSEFRLGQIKAFAITSLYPWDSYDRRLSWRVMVKGDQLRDFECDSCYALQLEGGGGFTFGLGTDWLALYALALAYFDWSGHLPKAIRFGPSLLTGAALAPFDRYKLHLNLQTKLEIPKSFDRTTFTELELGQSYSLSQSWALRLVLSGAPLGSKITKTTRDALVELDFYF